MVVPWLDSDNEFQRTAAIVAMAVMVEGCSEHIRKKYVLRLLLTYCKSLVCAICSCVPQLLQFTYKGDVRREGGERYDPCLYHV